MIPRMMLFFNQQISNNNNNYYNDNSYNTLLVSVMCLFDRLLTGAEL